MALCAFTRPTASPNLPDPDGSFRTAQRVLAKLPRFSALRSLGFLARAGKRPLPPRRLCRAEPPAIAPHTKSLSMFMFLTAPEILPFAQGSEPNVKQRLLGNPSGGLRKRRAWRGVDREHGSQRRS